MGVRLPMNFITSSGSVTLVTTALTGVLTLPPFSPSIDNAAIILLATIQIQYGTGTTSCVFTLNRGTLPTGPTVTGATGNVSRTVTAANFDIITICTFDVPGVVGGQQYTIGVQQVAATANGTVFTSSLIAMSL
jgi:hypothetical protein